MRYVGLNRKALGRYSDGVAGPAPVVDMDFRNYTNTAAFLADGTNWNLVEQQGGSEMLIDTTVTDPATTSTKTLRYHYNHGGGTGCTSITIENELPFPGGARQDAWAEFRVLFSANFTTANATCPPNDFKMIFGDTEAAQSGRWALYVGNGVPGSLRLKVERPSPSGGTGPYVLNMLPNFDATTLWDGAWHTFRVYFKHSTTTSSNDGRLIWWVDGARVHDETSFNTVKPVAEGSGVDRLTGFSFAHNKDDGPPNVDMYLWWSRIRYYFSDPGWVDGGVAGSVTALSRDLMNVTGAVPVTITGTGFSGTPTVLFGSTAATNVVVLNSTTITCTAPAHSAGLVAVTVADKTLSNAVRYTAAQTQGFLATFETGVLGSNVGSEVSGAGATVVVTNAVGDGAKGSDYFVRCTLPSGATEARINSALASSIVNLPLNGSDGFWFGFYVRCDDATANAVFGSAGKQIKLFIARDHDDTPHWPNIGIGNDFGSTVAGALRKKNDPSSSPVTPDGISLGTNLGTAAGWVRIDGHYVRSGGVGTYTFYVNFKQVASQADSTLGEDSTTDPATKIRIRPGIAFASGHASTLTLDIDRFYYGDGFVE
jgi:hypothetical protein